MVITFKFQVMEKGESPSASHGNRNDFSCIRLHIAPKTLKLKLPEKFP